MFGPFSSYVRPYRVRLLLGVLAIGIAQAASNYVPMVVKEAIDTLQTQHMSEAMRFRDIQTDVLGVVLLALLVALCSYVMRILLGRASARIEYDIRTAYFAHLLKQPLSYYQTQHTGDLMSRATNDLNSVRITSPGKIKDAFIFNSLRSQMQSNEIPLTPEKPADRDS